MTYSPLLSVITTVYNCEDHIGMSLDSVINQTFSDFEIIIVNDGSKDNTWDIVNSKVEKLQEVAKSVILINNSDNKKIPSRRNEAIALAKGKYIAINDGDDFSYQDRFEIQVDKLERDEFLFCVGGHAIKIDESDKVVGEMVYPPSTHEDIENTISKRCMNPMIDPTTVFRKQDFLDLGKYTLEQSIYTVPDFDLWCKAILDGKKFYNFQKPVIKYRKNSKGMTSLHKQEMIKAHMIVWRRFMSKFLTKERMNASKDI